MKNSRFHYDYREQLNREFKHYHPPKTAEPEKYIAMFVFGLLLLFFIAFIGFIVYKVADLTDIQTFTVSRKIIDKEFQDGYAISAAPCTAQPCVNAPTYVEPTFSVIIRYRHERLYCDVNQHDFWRLKIGDTVQAQVGSGRFSHDLDCKGIE